MSRATFSLVLVLSFLPACGDDDADVGTQFADEALIMDFADKVVIPTYEFLHVRAEALRSNVESLAAGPSGPGLLAAREAWASARRPWEQAEGFLFGPVDSNGYDPAMDSWPVNRTDLDAVLGSDSEFTPEYVLSLQETQKGFHTIEYLLFGEGGEKTAGDFTARELEYLAAVTIEFTDVTSDLATSWTEGLNGQPPYRDVFATAGPGNAAYPSLGSAVQEILGGMIAICDEVANGKIADPYDAMDPNLVESQFSYNSLDDFQDNMRSVQNVYLGSVPLAQTSGRGLSAWIAERDADLDARVLAAIELTLTTLGAIPEPFRDAITDPAAADEIEAAQAAINALRMLLEGNVTALVLQ